jgi:hypothetical protein
MKKPFKTPFKAAAPTHTCETQDIAVAEATLATARLQATMQVQAVSESAQAHSARHEDGGSAVFDPVSPKLGGDCSVTKDACEIRY